MTTIVAAPSMTELYYERTLGCVGGISSSSFCNHLHNELSTYNDYQQSLPFEEEDSENEDDNGTLREYGVYSVFCLVNMRIKLYSF